MNRWKEGNRGGRRGGRSSGRESVWRPRSRSSAEHSVAGDRPVGDHSGNAYSTPGSGATNIIRRHSERAAIDIVTPKFNELLTSDNPHGPNYDTIGVGNISPNVEDFKQGQNVHQSGQPPKLSVLQRVTGPGYHNAKKDEKHSQIMSSDIQPAQSSEEVQSGNSEGSSRAVEYENSHFQNKELSFDICEDRNKNLVRLKSPLLVTNRALRNEKKRHMEGKDTMIFRPGMILLKGYLSLKDQVKLIKLCRDLGRGPGGFYQPGYSDEATLHLKMMCLGKHWEPETGTYCDKRSIDEAKPPPIPDEFLQLVDDAMQECHGYLESHSKGKNVRSIIPSISPNICIVNFYTKTGKLGLHQDKDESQESLRRRLPVVSFSVGDSADFLFGDHRDIDKADIVKLESGDVLIFGGESRHIFHGVRSIHPGTAPEELIKETNLKAGRLNLTFREY